MIDYLKVVYGQLTYKDYAEILNKDFELQVKDRDVWLYFEPNINDEIEDLKLIYAKI